MQLGKVLASYINKWVHKMTEKVTDLQFSMASYVKTNLDDLKLAVSKKHDAWTIVDGPEGLGKSTFAAQCAYYCAYDPKTNKSTLTVNNFVWTISQFKRAVKRSKPGDCIIWDESVFGALSTEAMTETANQLIKLATTMRKKRLIIFMVIPYVFMLNKYFVGRNRGLWHVDSPDGIQRGWVNFYSRQQALYLYAEGRKHWCYPRKCHFSFHDKYYIKSLTQLGIDEAEYERRKDEAINILLQTKSDKKKSVMADRFYKCISFIKDKMKYNWKEIPDAIGINLSYLALQRGFSRYEERQAEEEEKKQMKLMREFKMPD